MSKILHHEKDPHFYDTKIWKFPKSFVKSTMPISASVFKRESRRSVKRDKRKGEEGVETESVIAFTIVLQQGLNKSLSFQDGPIGGTSFVNIYQNVRLDP